MHYGLRALYIRVSGSVKNCIKSYGYYKRYKSNPVTGRSYCSLLELFGKRDLAQFHFDNAGQAIVIKYMLKGFLWANKLASV